MKPTIRLRSQHDRDAPFLFRLFCSAHEYKFAPLGLRDDELTQLLRLQFESQDRQYSWQFRSGDFQIVLANDVPIGRLYVWRGAEEIVLIDVTILPEHCNGIGTSLVRQVIREADQCGKPLRAHVEKINRACKLWLRLGFRIVEDTGVYYRLEKPPACVDQVNGASPVAAVCETS